MSFLKKLLLLIGVTLATAYIVVGLIFCFAMQSNATRMVCAPESKLTSENEKSPPASRHSWPRWLFFSF